MVNLEVSGLPKLEGETREDCKQLAADVMKLVNSEFGIESVDNAHRKMASGLIVRFMNWTVRNEVFQKRFALQGKKSHNVAPRFAGTSMNIYIHENLSYARSLLLKSCRDKLKDINREVEDKDHRLKSKTVRGQIMVQEAPEVIFVESKHSMTSLVSTLMCKWFN